ncbi:MAG: HAD family hydrolase [SAR202 cluster bacterium]|nr:HAD family hydrolase [SAR202 cluster bacterium]
MIKAIVFDFDGVIIDTETPLFASWQEIFSTYNAHLEVSIWTKTIGTAIHFDFCQHLEDITGMAFDRDKLTTQRRQRYLDLVDAEPLLPGVAEYIESAERHGLSLGVASSSDEKWIVGHLTERGLLARFDAVKSRDHVEKAKPEPDLFLAAVEALGVRPEEAIAIEDSANGVTAAKRAGLYTVAVPNPMTRDLELDHADRIIDSLADTPLPQLLQQANDL